MYIYVCILYVCVRICMYIMYRLISYICMRVCEYGCTSISNVRTCVCVRVCAYVCVHR